MRKFALLLVFSIIGTAHAQSVDLRIQNRVQQTPVWCWAAVSEQIISWMNGGPSPAQCELVSIANGYNAPYCCNPPNPMIYQQCMRPGGGHEIQALIGYFSGHVSQIGPPTNPGVLFQIIQSGKPIILFIQSSPFSGHVVVLTGMTFVGNQAVLHINDPMNFFTQPVPFQSLLQYWRAALVVQ